MPPEQNRTNLKVTIANVVLLANAFVWYLLAFNTLKDLFTQANANFSETLTIIGINTGAIAIFGLVGSLLFDKFKRRKEFLVAWVTVGIIISIIPLGLDVTNLTSISIISLIFGAYFGLGMPATMAYHASVTHIGNRGKLSGFTFLIFGVTFAILSFVALDSIFLSSIILAFVRLIGLLFFIFVFKKESVENPTGISDTKKTKYRSIFGNKSFLFYFIPWILFTLINYLTIPIQRTIFVSEVDYQNLTAIESIVIAAFAVISGFIADKLGRKRLAIVGFIMLGIGYAVIGLFAISEINSVWGSIIYVVADGMAWGIFYVLFIFTLWGDLAQDKNADKIYFIGVLPYVSSYFMQQLLTPYLSEALPATIFPFASVFLFLAVLPLIYAPETLPEKIMKDRDLKSYIENAKKKAVKDAEKVHKKDKDQNPKTSEPAEKDANYEKAKQLAEKYY